MSVSCHNLEFGRTRLEFAACGCSSNASPNRLSVRNRAKALLRNVNSGCKARKLLCSRREIGRCRVFSTKTPEAFLSGVAAGPPPVLDLTKEPTGPSSLADMFEVVAEDLLTLNKNLQSVSANKPRFQWLIRWLVPYGLSGINGSSLDVVCFISCLVWMVDASERIKAYWHVYTPLLSQYENRKYVVT
ncbi:UNVERIFIED_CONTAM: hypothetical protein Sangu_2429000 [Sesamum angustifolium]|uniref:Uncharacterized protein n=1 Tax=Sesamum angustifolium TaxID=2727405 RepID=A0AAW2KXL7_9LAMI